MTWSGQWVADRLAIELHSEQDELTVPALVGIALRHNPRRTQLLVSTVLGKHVPTDPDLVYAAGRLLGVLVAERLAGAPADSASGRALLAAALRGEPGAARKLLGSCEQLSAPVPATVVGYAETATGLGHAVADSLGAAYLHSTRRAVAGAGSSGSFAEEHSHATDHLLTPTDPRFLAGAEALVLVDDELSTGRTAANTIRALRAANPTRSRYLVATLVDTRSSADRSILAELGAELGAEITVLALATGTLDLPPGVLARGQQLVAEQDRPPAAAAGTSAPTGTSAPSAPAAPAGTSAPAGGRYRWPVGITEGGRHGTYPADRAILERAAAATATDLATDLAGGRVLVLGFEELMYAPLRIATELGRRVPAGVQVRYSTTTRSPALAVDDPGYPLRTRLTFSAHDNPSDGPGRRYAYNVAAGSDPTRRFTDIVLVLDDAGDTPELVQLTAQLGAECDRLHQVVIPARGPLPMPLHGPAFGSYAPHEVSWLLTDLSHVQLEAPTEEREEAMQSGGAHYAQSLPIEFQPSAEYQTLFTEALKESAAKVALAVGVVTDEVLARRGPGAVLVSLARAGTPIGILMRRWAQAMHSVELAHYAVSIVRDRGIDPVALRYLATQHDPAAVMFVDGWTGKGAITRELAAAVAAHNTDFGTAFSAELAVLADTGSCVDIFGTRADYLIPSACLNSTVSGLVSRTVLNTELLTPAQFHGAKFYAQLAEADVSNEFLDAVTACFSSVQDEVTRTRAVPRATAPTWAGWTEVERIAAAYGISNVNLVKPGVGETTRVLLRRVPWKVLMRRDAAAGLGHVQLLAAQRGVEVEFVAELAYSCVGLIRELP